MIPSWLFVIETSSFRLLYYCNRTLLIFYHSYCAKIAFKLPCKALALHCIAVVTTSLTLSHSLFLSFFLTFHCIFSIHLHDERLVFEASYWVTLRRYYLSNLLYLSSYLNRKPFHTLRSIRFNLCLLLHLVCVFMFVPNQNERREGAFSASALCFILLCFGKIQ